MNIFKKRSTAIIVTTVICILGLLFGVHKSVNGQIKKLENSFENGVYLKDEGYTQTGIGQQLSEREVSSLGLVTILSNYEGLEGVVTDLRAARIRLIDAVGIGEMYRANEDLQDAYNAALDACASISIDSSYIAAFDSYCSTMDNAQIVINSSQYNNSVSEFERSVLGSFPVSILKYIAFTDSPEYFGLEG